MNCIRWWYIKHTHTYIFCAKIIIVTASCGFPVVVPENHSFVFFESCFHKKFFDGRLGWAALREADLWVNYSKYFLNNVHATTFYIYPINSIEFRCGYCFVCLNNKDKQYSHKWLFWKVETSFTVSQKDCYTCLITNSWQGKWKHIQNLFIKQQVSHYLSFLVSL